MNKIMIMADIEGTSGCWNYRASKFKSAEWVNACYEMSLDINSAVKALFKSGIKQVIIKDFHRTGYNILKELIDPRAKLISGYKQGPLFGIGDPEGSEGVIFLGMHAASGTDGFISHTMSLAIKKLEINGKSVSELEIFSSLLYPFNIKPIFFSGCPVACSLAREAIPHIETYPIDKSGSIEHFDKKKWRINLSDKIIKSLSNTKVQPFQITAPYNVVITWKNKQKAQKIAKIWKLKNKENTISFRSNHFNELYMQLIRIFYFKPFYEKILPIGFFFYNLLGRSGLNWVRNRLKEIKK